MPSRLAPPPLPHDARVAGAYAQPLLELAQERGLALDALARAVGMPSSALAPLPESLTAPDYVRLLDAGAELLQDPHFGLHLGSRVKLGTYSVYGLILLSCRDFGQVFAQTLRFEGLAHDLGRSALKVHDGVAEYVWHSHFPHASHHLAESVFAGVRVFGEWLAGGPLPHASVAFMHPAPQDCSEHHRVFGPQVQFGATHNSAHFDAALLAQPVPHADTGLYPVLQQHAEQLLAAKQRAQSQALAEGAPDVSAQVRACLQDSLSQDRARLPLVAHTLGLTPRTLQRKLSAAGTNFQQLLDQTRRDLADAYLQQPGLSLTDIAFLLGYQEQSAFSHAFKEWTGHSPGRLRDR